ncbi:DUF1415 domain-containing protein [Azoarcus taiwanensis]|uniref:DUF1415 family protein n=1 Tax=Azoarcus taiwanensis TaxID=666964 RepID=A0A972FFN3_9RHOO|nr:DUF1415 domain-containing protein [Azoarcus taiwanensis]NMG04472.1 DUF1415 family protein [Azoarcus taiwanensis]
MNRDEVLAATRLWIEKAVIGLELCPFARQVYVRDQVRYVVSEAKHLDAFLEQLDEELELLAETEAEKIDTTLLIHPTLFADFETFNEVVGIAEEAVLEHDLEGVLQVASFHPRFRFEGTEEDDIANYTNRAPFPTLHLLREDSLAKALAAYPGDPDEIYKRNIETLKALGQSGWSALGLHDAAPPPNDDSSGT